ncbi:hypothetical protein FRC0552_01994 [Corynebacterium diphtheriae]|nr:hypothetical protein FRC0552_01994 [Corynebacterium diphtheriae]
MDVSLKPDDRAEEETEHDKPVRNRNSGFASELGMEKYLDERLPYAPAKLLRAAGGGLSLGHELIQVRRRANEVEPRGRGQDDPKETQHCGDGQWHSE